MLNLANRSAQWAPPPPKLRATRRMDATNGGGLTRPADPELSDQTAWMLAVRDRRDRRAFGMLFDFYGPRLKAFVMRSGASGALAEDIVQDVMLAVWHRAGQFDPARAHVSGWIYRIARNRQIDLARKARRALPEEIDHERAEDEPVQRLAMDQEATQLRDALARLKPEQKQMIEKAFLGELSHSEIQDDTGLPLGTIKSRIRLGLERLRHELKGLRQG